MQVVAGHALEAGSDMMAPAPSGSVLSPGGGARPEHYNIAQAADRLGVSRVTIWRWIRAGRLPVARLGHRTVRIRRDDVERLLATTGGSTDTDHALGLDWRRMGPTEHFVQLYEADVYLVEAVSAFIGTGLAAGEAGAVIATADHRAAIEAQLRASGLDLDAARLRGQYVALDAAETLARFSLDGEIDPERFAAMAGGIITDAARVSPRVRVFGEMVALLALDGNLGAAVRLEHLWNELQSTHAFSLFCAYPINRLGGDAMSAMLTDVCAAHSRVIPAESYTTLPTVDDRLRAVMTLQQKARWLEIEIAERTRAEEELRLALAAEQTARREAEDALRLRDEFLSIASHELKTPLTGLLALAQLNLRRLRRSGQPDTAQPVQALEAIVGQADRLSRLIARLLDASQLDGGTLRLVREPADLVPLIEQVIVAVRARADACAITFAAPTALPAVVDALRLEQVVSNLLDNAIKYSPRGARVDVVLSRAGRGVVELSVRDRGPGIPVEMRDRIFERFFQADDRGFVGGLGLGLYISRQIVDLHGGEIRAEFPSDGGTRMIVRLPIEPVPSAVLAGSPAPSRP